MTVAFRAEARALRQILARIELWVLVACVLLGVSAAYQVRHAYDIDVGSPADQAYVRNLHERAGDGLSGPTFRPTDTYSYISLPGIGGGLPYSVTVTLKPAAALVPVTVILNGETFWEGPLKGEGWRKLTFGIDNLHPRALASRDLVIEFRAPAASQLLVDRVQVSEQAPGFLVPALSQLAFIAAIVVLAYLVVGRALQGHHVARWLSFGAAVFMSGALLALLAILHLPLTVATPHLVVTGVLTYGLLVVTEPVARRLAPGAAGVGSARLAAVLVAAAFMVRYGLMALPESVIIDMPYHLKWLNELLAGNVAALVDPHGGLNQPPREWGLAIVIPKSPLFYFIALPLAWLPGDLDKALAGFVCLLEASTPLFCYGLLARFAPGVGGPRAGLWAGFAYAMNPLGFRALAYGILPTILAQWLTLVCFTLILAWASLVIGTWRPAVHPSGPGMVEHAASNGTTTQRLIFAIALLVLLPVALVAFPTIAVFTTLVIIGLVAAWRGGRYRRVGLALAAVMVVAWVVALVTYYGPYLADLLTRTLPQLLGLTQPGARAGTAPVPSTVHWTGPFDLLTFTLNYVVSPLPLLLGLAGLTLLWIASRSALRRTGQSVRGEALLALLAACWVAILPLFVAANYRFDMIGKHLFYTMVPLSLGSGIYLWSLARRGPRARLLAWLLAGTLAWSALTFWVERLVRVSS